MPKFSQRYIYKGDLANLVQLSTKDGVLELWHRQLGHLNIKSVHALQSIMSGMKIGKIPRPTFLLVCETCMEGKQYRASFLNNRGT